MSDLLLSIMVLSVALQCLAAFLAIRLIRISGGLAAWTLLSCAFLLMGLRRVVTFLLIAQGVSEGDLVVEVIGLLVSLVLVAAVSLLPSIFKKLTEANLEVRKGKDELAKSHQELLESETRYRTVANFTSDWEFWIAPDRTLRYISPSCQQISGYCAQEFYDDPELICKIVHPEDVAAYRNHTHDLLDTGSPRPIDFRIITKSGDERWISHLCRTVLDTDGSPLGFRASNRDITERKRIEQLLHQHAAALQAEVEERQRAQEELAAQQLQLEALNRTLEERVEKAVAEVREKDQLMISQSRRAAMGEMISYIAHQWKHPLNNLGLLIQTASHEFGSSLMTAEEMARYMDKGMEIIAYMSDTIDDFRDFFREDKEKKPFSIGQCVIKAISLVEASLKDNKIGFEVDCGTEVQVVGYCNEFAQVLLNLLGNARDALVERGVPDPSIVVSCFVEDGSCVVTVADNAGGIPEELIGRIFDLYFTTKGEGEGSGIGLFMARTIMEKNMGGRLSVRNVGQGAEFRMEIPL